MDSAEKTEYIGMAFICVVLGCYLALVIRDRWRQYRRMKRIEKEGRYLGTPVTMVVLKTPEKKEDLKQ